MADRLWAGPAKICPNGEEMHKDTGLLKFWIVLGIGTKMASKHSITESQSRGDRKHIPEAQNAVESVLRTELLDALSLSQLQMHACVVAIVQPS